MNRRTIALLMVLSASLILSASSDTSAACDCLFQGQCSYNTCCFVHNDCMPNSKQCDVRLYGQTGNYTCDAVGTCQYNGPSCGGGDEMH